MLSADFARTLREAQAGDQKAFLRLWRDANPVMIRYLRVAGVEDPYDSAAQGWVAVVRGMSRLGGDEIAWRAWVLRCTRQEVDEAAAPQGRGSASLFSGLSTETHHDFEHPIDLATAESLNHRGIDQTIAAIRDLPMGQGEILMLRLAAGLPVTTVAEIVGTDVVAVRRVESGAVDRLGVERELLAWSLTAPPIPIELRDHRGPLRAFVTEGARRPPAPHTRVIAIGGPARQPGLRQVRSRLLTVGIAALSASAMSLGGLSAAAYVGMLPPAVQRVMHLLIGAPAPTATSDHSGQVTPGAGPTQRAPRATTRPGGSSNSPGHGPTVGLTRSPSRPGAPPGNPTAPGRAGTPKVHVTSKEPHPTQPSPVNTNPANTHPASTHPTGTHPTSTHVATVGPTTADPASTHPTSTHPTNVAPSHTNSPTQ